MANSRRHRQREEAPIDREYHGALTVSPSLNSEIGSTVAGVLADPDADIRAATQSLVGAIESANRSHICGWAWNPQNPEAPVTLELLDGEGPLLAVVADEERPDLAASGIGDGRYGFKIDLSLFNISERTRQLEVRFAETGAPLSGSPVHIDGVGAPMSSSAHLLSSAMDLENTAEQATRHEAVPAAVGRPLAPDTIDIPSLVVGRAVHPATDGVHGDPTEISALLRDGAPRRSGQKGDALQNGHMSTADGVHFSCHIDEISSERIEGWLMAPSNPSHRCVVVLKEGDRVHARARASRFREDLVSAGVGDGCYCFQLEMPDDLLDGAEHVLELVEEETGFRVTDEPVRWRSALVSDARSTKRGGATDIATVSHAPISYNALLAHAEGPRVLFDISDLIYYIGEHANLTGIQRVQSSIVLSILTHELLPVQNVVFLSFNARKRNWVSIPTGFLASLLNDLLLPLAQRTVTFPAEEARYGLLPGAREFDGIGVLDDGFPSVLCLLGAAWVHQDYLNRVLALKRQFGTRFVMTVHDLIPVYARETCDQDTARVFEEFMRHALRHADYILSVSENTAEDIRRYTSSLQIRTPPIAVTKNGSSFAEFLPKLSRAGGRLPAGVPERFVLFVATIEGRKNHQLMLDIWRQMIEEGDDVPALVCVGRLGWKSSAFVSTLVETDYLDGRVILLREISDSDLRTLYDRCLFTVCPTFYEGWGLPIGEALSMGKICVCSDRASVPEVAGDCGVYIDINDLKAAKNVVRNLIASDATRTRLEAKIRRDYQFITWQSVAERVIGACRAAPEIPWPHPYPYTEIPYSSEISFAKLDRNIDGTGELLLTRIAGNRQGVFLADPLNAQSFARGDEARSGGHWAYPEAWGTWACHTGGEIAVGLPANDCVIYYVFLRLRASGPVIEQPLRLYVNGEELWRDAIGPLPRNIVLRVRKRARDIGGWRLQLRAAIDLTEDKRAELAADDSRIPTIGFERMMVVPENDLKTRVDMLYMLLL